MKFGALLSVVCGSAAAVASDMSREEMMQEFESWMVSFDKSYPSVEEKIARFNIFAKNVVRVAALNIEHPEAKFGLNLFSDLTDEEREAKMNPNYKPLRTSVPTPAITSSPSRVGEKVSYVGCWREARNQENCGSCWAFATSAVVESTNCERGAGPVEFLSPQELVDCDVKQDGCDGASTLLEPLKHVVQHGLVEDSAYPYEQEQGLCKEKDGKRLSIAGAVQIEGMQSAMEHLDKHGALMVGIGAGFQFSAYDGGVLTPGSCNDSRPNHAVTLVGYEVTEEDRTVFTIRNSWGAKWGEEGYVRLTWGACLLGVDMVGALRGESSSHHEERFLRM